jgi:hypothetical protein
VAVYRVLSEIYQFAFQLVLNEGTNVKTFVSAAGLYYLAELVEEYTVMTKRIIWWMTVVSKYAINVEYLKFYLCEWFHKAG